MINQIKEIFNTILNKEGRGEISPTEFNGLLEVVQMNIFKTYLEELRKNTRLNNRGVGFNGLANAKLEILEKLRPFRIRDRFIIDNNTCPYPKKFAFLNPEGVIVSDFIATLITDDNRRFLKSQRGKINNQFPVYEVVNEQILFYPKIEIKKTVELDGIRFPKAPKWTFREIGNSFIFNPSAQDFQDIELHHTELPEVIWGLCSLAGVRLKEVEITQIMESLKDKDFQKSNIN